MKNTLLHQVKSVHETGVTPTPVRALRIADNKLAELSDWNEEALQIELGELMDLSLAGELDFDLDITGFEIPEIDIIIGSASAAAKGEVETMEDPERSRPPVARPGDLWVLGEHCLFCGDALEAKATPPFWARMNPG